MLDVIIPAKGKPDLTQQCISTLFKHHGSLDMTVYLHVEEGDAELQPLYAEWRSLGVEVREFPKPRGFSQCINRVAAVTKEPIICLLNNDVHFTQPALKPMLDHFYEADVAVVGCKLLYSADRLYNGVVIAKGGTIQHAGCLFNLRNGMSHIGVGEHASRYPYCRDVHGSTFALAMLRRSVFETELPTSDGLMRSLDEACGWSGVEDTDFCVRVQEAGFRVLYCADAVAWHEEGGTRGRDPNMRDPGLMHTVHVVSERWHDAIKQRLHED